MENTAVDFYPVKKTSVIGRFIVQDNYAVTFRGTNSGKCSEAQTDALKKNWGKIEYTGKLSTDAKKQIRTFMCVWSRAIEGYNRIQQINKQKEKRKLVFITLTLSSVQVTSDNHVKRSMLSAFIQELRRKWNVCHYFWRAESQKNGNIHFHILVDSYIPKNEVAFIWDSIQFNHKYIKIKPLSSENYKSASTRIEAPKENGSIAIYCVKYCLKEDGYRIIKGRLWGCSDSLRELEAFECELDNDMLKSLEKLEKSKKLTVCPSMFYDLFIGDVYSYLRKENEAFAYVTDLYNYEIYHCLYSDASSIKNIIPEDF